MAQILLVDDEKVARAMYADFLTGAGHSVTAVGSAADAFAALTSQRFNVMVTDLILPNTDGLEVLQQVKTKHPDVEVIVITALDKVEPAVRAIKGGAADYLVKPVSPAVLAHAVSRAMTQHSLLKENESLRQHVALLETGHRIATTLDRERLIEAASTSFEQTCGARAVVLYLRDGDSLAVFGKHGVAGDDDATLKAFIERAGKQALTAGKPGELVEGDVPSLWKSAFVVPTYDGDAMLGGVLLLFEQTVEPHHTEDAAFLARHVAQAFKNLGKFAEVEDLVYLDDLTHLFNSRYLELILEKQFRETAAGDKPFSLLFSDLDHFKSINDTHGHVVGSKLLVEVAKVLKGCVRDNDVVCRWGGDEYVMLLRGTDSGGALKVGERIRRSVESHRFLAREGYSLHITTTIGVASFPETAQDKAGLLDLADRAMYRGKKGSRNIIYLASKGFEATPAARQKANQDVPPNEKT